MEIEQFDVKKGKGIITIVVVVAIVIIVFVFGKNIVQFIQGLFGKTSDPNAIDAHNYVTGYDYSSANPTSPFSPQVYNNRPAGETVIADSDAQHAAGQIKDATGLFFWSTIDAGQALAALKNCKTQCDVSYVSIQYANEYSTDMYDDMSKWFNSDTNIEIMKQIIQYCIALPVY